MAMHTILDRYDVIVAGARCAGASTAMLLARRGFRVLVVDPVPAERDPLSTHALMRGGVLQLHRWGLLEAIRAAGTPAVRTTVFHYEGDRVVIPIKSADGIDALYAPRRTVLDPVLVAAARRAGAHVVHGLAVMDLVRDRQGRVRGAMVGTGNLPPKRVLAGLVIGADGLRSQVARLVDAPVEHETSHAAATVYGYWSDPHPGENHWYFTPGASVGTISTNHGETCVFAALPATEFASRRGAGLPAVHRRVVQAVSPELGEVLGTREPSGRLRAFAGARGFLRRSVGPGWALVGDAGYFKDPATAHGITDALRDAELLARAVSRSGEDALEEYQAIRDQLVKGFMTTTDRIAAFDWDLDEVRRLHLALSQEMNEGVDRVREFDVSRRAPVRSSVA